MSKFTPTNSVTSDHNAAAKIKEKQKTTQVFDRLIENGGHLASRGKGLLFADVDLDKLREAIFWNFLIAA